MQAEGKHTRRYGRKNSKMAADEVLPATDDPDSAQFWASARNHQLVVQRCDACAHHRFPPHPYCPECRSADVSWVPVSGRGSIWTYAFVYKPMIPAFAPYTPYPVVYVELADHPGLRMTGNLVTHAGAPINSVDQDRVKIGAAVEVVFDDVADDVTLPRWRLVDE